MVYLYYNILYMCRIAVICFRCLSETFNNMYFTNFDNDDDDSLLRGT